MVVEKVEDLFVVQERGLAVQVLMMGVLLRPQFVLSMDTVNVPLISQVGLSVDPALVEEKVEPILGTVMVVVEMVWQAKVVEEMFVAQGRDLAVLGLTMGVLLRPLFVLSMVIVSVPPISRVGLSVDLDSVEVAHQTLGLILEDLDVAGEDVMAAQLGVAQ